MDKQEAKHINMPSPSACEHKSVEAYLFIDPLCKIAGKLSLLLLNYGLNTGNTSLFVIS